MVFGKLKYLFLFLYDASERLEQKSKEFAKARAKRMEKFREEQAAAREQMRAAYAERKEEIKKQFQEIIGETGVATKSEIDELKKSIADLAAKVEEITKK